MLHFLRPSAQPSISINLGKIKQISKSTSSCHVSGNSCDPDSVMAMWYPCHAWFHGIIHNSAWSLRLKLEFLDEADQEQKQLCLGYTFPRADPFANLEWNHPLIPLVFSILNEPCGVKLGGIYPGVLSHHDFM